MKRKQDNSLIRHQEANIRTNNTKSIEVKNETTKNKAVLWQLFLLER